MYPSQGNHGGPKQIPIAPGVGIAENLGINGLRSFLQPSRSKVLDLGV